MLRCWHLVRILVRTDHPCLGVGCHSCHHLSAGIVRLKLVEFLELRQGNRYVYEYTQEFNNLAQYGGHHVDTDAKKAELYCKGLNIQL
jgi:hypothetical protein